MNTRVAVVGSANADLVVRVDRRPLGGETLLGGDLDVLPGGKGANQAAAAGRCGADVSLIARLGDDPNGALLRRALADAGVDTSATSAGSRPTGTAIIFLTPDGENSIVVSPGANGELDIAAVERARSTWATARVVVLSLEIPLDTVRHVVLGVAGGASEHATDHPSPAARIVLNAAPARHLDGEILRAADPLIVNEHEALEVLGVDATDPDANNYDRLAERLTAAGARSVVITLGAEGSVVAQGGTLTRVPAHRVPVVDTTGAGDAFVGATAHMLAGGATLEAAVRYATAVSALAVQRLGAQASYPSHAEVAAFLRETDANSQQGGVHDVQ